MSFDSGFGLHKLWKHAYSSNDKIPVWIPAVFSDEVNIYPQLAIASGPPKFSNAVFAIGMRHVRVDMSLLLPFISADLIT